MEHHYRTIWRPWTVRAPAWSSCSWSAWLSVLLCGITAWLCSADARGQSPDAVLQPPMAADTAPDEPNEADSLELPHPPVSSPPTPWSINAESTVTNVHLWYRSRFDSRGDYDLRAQRVARPHAAQSLVLAGASAAMWRGDTNRPTGPWFKTAWGREIGGDDGNPMQASLSGAAREQLAWGRCG